MNDGLETILKGIGVKVGRQNYPYHTSGDTYTGENIYAILQAPRGDATEAIVLVAPWRNTRDELNRNGLALALTLTRYFKRWSLWSKDIILVIPPDSRTGTQAWADAYHDAHDPRHVAPLPLKSGALQGALALDYPHEHRFESLHIVYDGVNGQLPNLDLINSVVNIANGQHQGSVLHRMWRHRNSYQDRLKTMLRGMVNQGLGHSTGAHSSFIPYHVDAITIQPVGRGWHDEMGLGRVVEGAFRSLNNLVEHLHQSFFFYLLMNKDRFVSIGTYLPSAMLVAANFTIMAISLWVQSGYADQPPTASGPDAKTTTTKVERHVFRPLGLVVGSQLLGVVPLFIFNHTPSNVSFATAPPPIPPILLVEKSPSLTFELSQFLTPVFILFAVANGLLPHLLSRLISPPPLPSSSSSPPPPPAQFYQLLKAFSLLLLGMFLSALATLNFSLALLVGLLATPLTFTPVPFSAPAPGNSSTVAIAKKTAYAFLLPVLSPPTVLAVAVSLLAFFARRAAEGEGGDGIVSAGLSVAAVLREAAFGWDVWGLYTPLIVWCVWWPAWLVGFVVLLGGGGGGGPGANRQEKQKAL